MSGETPNTYEVTAEDRANYPGLDDDRITNTQFNTMIVRCQFVDT